MVPPWAPSFGGMARGKRASAAMSAPAASPCLTLARLTGPGEVAQSVEHTAENRGVAGSIPALAIFPPLGCR